MKMDLYFIIRIFFLLSLLSLFIFYVVRGRKKFSIVWSHREFVFYNILWVLFVLIENFILGPASVGPFGDGSTLLTGYAEYLAQNPDKLLLHEFVGGLDRYAMGPWGSQLFSFQLMLVSVLPLWLAILAVKALALAMGMIGVQLVLRRIVGNDQKTAFAIAAFFVVSTEWITTLSFLFGITAACVPLLLYLLTRRFANYDLMISIIVMALYAASTELTSSFPIVLFTIFLFVLLFPPESWGLFFLKTTTLVSFVVLNSIEHLYAVMAYLPYSNREAVSTPLGAAWPLFFDFKKIFSGGYSTMVPLLFVVFVFLSSANIRMLKVVLLLAVSLFLGAFIDHYKASIPILDIGIIQSFHFVRQHYSVLYLLPLFAGYSAIQMAKNRRFASDGAMARAPFALFMALALSVGGATKLYAAAHMIENGGLKTYTSIPNLKYHPWYTGERIVSYPWRIEKSTLVSYGFNTAEGYVIFVPRSLGRFWAEGILGNREIYPGAMGIPIQVLDYRCCDSYDIDKIVSLPLLRMINVGFFASMIPFRGGRLELVSRPEPRLEEIPYRDLPLSSKLADRFEELIQPSAAYIYRIPAPLPLFYGARAFGSLAGGDPVAQLIANAPEILAGKVLIPEGDASRLGGASTDLEVTGFRQTADGYVVEVEAPRGGLLVANFPWLPWWEAEYEDARLEVVAVNFIHMGIIVPAGAREIKFSYRRPTLL